MAKTRRKGTAVSIDATPREYRAVSARKISNGWLCEYTIEKNGRYDRTEVYHPKRPKLDAFSLKSGSAKAMAKQFQRFV